MASRSEPTAYGTSSLASDERLSARAAARRKWIKWGLIGASTGIIAGGLLVLGFSTSGSHSAASTVATATPDEGDVTCFQSSYVANVTNMMQPIQGLKWQKGGEKNVKSFIAVDLDTKFQEIMGFGGAFTEAAALQFQKLSLEKQEEVLTLYFDKEKGSAYSFGRVPMGSCDFSVASYSFAETVDDMDLVDFDVDVTHDMETMIPFIKRALERRPDMKLFLAPWSPPAWMKRSSSEYNASMLGSLKPVGLRDDMRAPWALYFSKFITAYKKHGIPFWGLSPQNEPEFAAPWEACAYDPEYEAEFIGEYLGPVLDRDHPDLTLMVFDHNRNNVHHWAEVIYNHPTASKYVDGMAFHWYEDGGERYMDGVDYPEHLNDTHYVDQNRFMLASESCNCPGVAVGQDAWFRAQRYGHDILSDLNNHVAGWVDWNLLLDHTGGPNHKGNLCDAPIILTKDGSDFKIQPMYYFIQHFSRFIPVGSRRVNVQVAAHFEKPGDAQLYVDYQSSLATCDGSSRQTLHRTDDNKVQVTNTPFCLNLVPTASEGHEVRLGECRWMQQTWTFEEDTQRIRIDDICLSLSRGSTEDGVRVTADKCEDEVVPHQQWTFNAEDGTLRSLASATDQCVTTGYSFVQATAFVTPDNRKVLVVMNENTETAEFQVQVGDDVLDTSVLSGAIRTFVW
ncbi:putative GH30 glucocerebrosidase/glucosylceramidase precursor [Phytophthora sojae]|uniref:GH30 glucocerebrosidase/glucosylceramidase n=1 Tax=Phytophthora sojae (strain P6497) TaxID=1094619 RepID=G5AA24_PHYSP|nr:putative GH30 glucocerebrosidase/glucosylceramidase precursor [Phytophthora sojae]EGZ07453.1 putative GH30 glucocerebrosidase/glucosylceramidase precursor [Phytophthora sojae]|eukprot:XP_009537019.1 putative GH30 glucocerebrosidase/glucosylceramidase precursor [Phytophthora sojae]